MTARKLLPAEPTEDMRNAAIDAGDGWLEAFADQWTAAVAAAPPLTDADIERVAAALFTGRRTDISWTRFAAAQPDDAESWRNMASAAIAALEAGDD